MNDSAALAEIGEKLSSVEAIIEGLSTVGYIASRRIATAIFVAQNLNKPILVEGSAGVGKTELALSTANWLGLPLIRMQCYEGLDEAKALYEWKYGKQLLYTQILKDKVGDVLEGTEGMDEAMERLRGFGVDLPVHVGIAGPARLQTLIKFAIACGVGSSLKVLQRRAMDVSKLVLPYEPTDVLVDFAAAAKRDGGSAVAQIHFFPLGGIGACADWAVRHGVSAPAPAAV